MQKREKLTIFAFMSNTFSLWFKIVRPQTLAASLCPVLVGLAVCGVQKPLTAVLTAVCALALQIFSNLVNDYYDFVRGTDKKGRTGFSRALAEGLVTKEQMKSACIAAVATALAIGICLVTQGGVPIIAIGATAILFAWLYTATSHSLSYLGIADIFVFLYYGVIATAGTVWLQTGTFSRQAFWAGAVCGLISMCVLIANNLRDIDGDREAGKKTFPVRFGKRAGEIGYLAVILLTPVCSWLAFGLNWTMVIVIPGLLLFRKVLHAEGAQYNICLMMAGLLNILFTILCFIFV